MAPKTAPIINLPRNLPDPPSPGEFARMTERERTVAMGDTLFAFGQALPAIVAAIDRHELGILEANASASGARAESTRAADAATRTEAKLDAFLRMPVPFPPPPMRAESPSQMDLRQTARNVASGEFERMARTSGGPPEIVQATPAKLTAVTESVVEKVLIAREATAKAKADADRLAALDAERVRLELEAKARVDRAAKDRRKVVMAALLAAAGVIGTAAATRIVSKAEGMAEGRQQGVAEGHDMAIKEVRASATTAPAAPAAVAPR